MGENQHYLEMKCQMRRCGKIVMNCDDYMGHLTVNHGLTHGIPALLKQFEDKIKEERGEQKRKVEVIDIADNEVEESEEENTEEVSEYDKIKLKEVMKRALENVLKPLSDIIEDHLDISRERTDTMNEATPDIDCLGEEFQSLKNVFRNIKFPKEMSNAFTGGEDPEPPAMKSLPSNPPPPDSDSPRSRSDKSSCSTRKRRMSSASTASSGSSASSTSSTRCLVFLCPLPNCSFSTDKAGMVKGTAAIHISKFHGVSNKMIKTETPGTYTFKKVKREI